ncbi:peptidogalycan biosysnthesis protein [uncultured Kordia sp.]|uniref:peptidogalycan biosysnthesis protein n=1 Tax=uncultured Kordia sp. TaxID=507699 RepID=UPI00262BB252|nr:peptidogalycan biosysnthesis protein [uncultured Kordia sp.]
MSNTNALFFNAVNDIPQEYWQQLQCTENTYYTPEFLHAYEIANDDIVCRYIVIVNKKQEATAFAITQLVTIPIETITQNIKISDTFKKRLNGLFCNSTARILFCGNIFLSGEYGTFIKDGEDINIMFHALAKALKKLMKNTKRLQAVFVKDFKKSSLTLTDQLQDYKYAPMKVEPNMIITLQPEWKSFDDYKNALKSKYRVKANKADKKSKNLIVKQFTAQEIENHKSELQALYENTIANANFNAQVLNLNTYTHLKASYGDQFIVKGYFLEDKLIGFLSAMVNQENLDAHFIGLDYSMNKEYAIYPRILNDYVRLGIQHQATRINLGRTASEIKSTLGAKPQDLTCYIRHKKPLLNAAMRPFIKNIKIKSFKEHKPFKE